MTDRTEQLIRDAFAAEADRAPDPRTVLAGLARAPRRRHGMTLLAAGVAMVAVVAIAVAAFVVPKALDRGAPPATGNAAVDQTVLLAGLDRARYTDAIMLARVRADGSTAVVSLPRDSWVDVPGHGKQRLSVVYARFGLSTLVQTVDRLTGVRADHYALLDMAGFGELADVVGGVPVCLRAATTDNRHRSVVPGGPADRVRRQGARVPAPAARAAERRPRPDRPPAGVPALARRRAARAPGHVVRGTGRRARPCPARPEVGPARAGRPAAGPGRGPDAVRDGAGRGSARRPEGRRGPRRSTRPRSARSSRRRSAAAPSGGSATPKPGGKSTSDCVN